MELPNMGKSMVGEAFVIQVWFITILFLSGREIIFSAIPQPFPHYIFSFLWNSTLFLPSNIFIPPKFSLIKTWMPVTKHLLCTRHYASVSSCKEADREERGKLFQYYFPTSRFAINIIFSAAKCRVLPASYCNPWEMVRIN